VVWHHSLLLINSFNKTEAAVFSCRLCFQRVFLFISFIYTYVILFVNRTFQIFNNVFLLYGLHCACLLAACVLVKVSLLGSLTEVGDLYLTTLKNQCKQHKHKPTD